MCAVNLAAVLIFFQICGQFCVEDRQTLRGIEAPSRSLKILNLKQSNQNFLHVPLINKDMINRYDGKFCCKIGSVGNKEIEPQKNIKQTEAK